MAIITHASVHAPTYECIKSCNEVMTDRTHAVRILALRLSNNIIVKVAIWETGYMEIKQLPNFEPTLGFIQEAPTLLDQPYMKEFMQALVDGLPLVVDIIKFKEEDDEEEI